jgi:hypothetical protein
VAWQDEHCIHTPAGTSTFGADAGFIPFFDSFDGLPATAQLLLDQASSDHECTV